jgi:UDP:flavonoid glycosyltransferase YjiC (YdhE family)
MHAVLASIGTDGDVVPYVGLGVRLRARGHRVTLATNEHYRARAAELGFDFRPLVTEDEFRRFLGDPDLWHPLKSALVGVRLGVGILDRQYATLAELARDGDPVFVASPAIVAARLVQEALGRPLASVLLQPWMVPSIIAPPVMPGGLTLPRWAPVPLGRLYWRLVDAVGDLLVGRAVNRLRTSLRLKTMRRIFQWWLSPDLVLGMFTDWYGPPQRDWPPPVKLTGFPLYDGEDGRLPAEVLDFCRTGAPPVAFTLGTGMMHAERFFRAALGACHLLGVRGLFLTKYRHHLPASLPPTVRHFEFAPFLQLLPHCAALVHHGGVGTVAKALATGTPQLVLPLSWDQPDNALRVKCLGAGDWLPPKERDGPDLARALARLLDPGVRERCRLVAGKFGTGDAFDLAVRWIEELAANPGCPGGKSRYTTRPAVCRTADPQAPEQGTPSCLRPSSPPILWPHSS